MQSKKMKRGGDGREIEMKTRWKRREENEEKYVKMSHILVTSIPSLPEPH
jgi:hypothetical protein